VRSKKVDQYSRSTGFLVIPFASQEEVQKGLDLLLVVEERVSMAFPTTKPVISLCKPYPNSERAKMNAYILKRKCI